MNIKNHVIFLRGCWSSTVFGEKTQKPVKKEQKLYHCDDQSEYGSEGFEEFEQLELQNIGEK